VIYVIPHQKFKTAVCCALLRQPLNKETATANAVISQILGQGCAKYPATTQLESVLENLYGAIFDCQIVKKGEQQIIQFYFEGLEQLFLQGCELINEIMCNPLIVNNGFSPVYTSNGLFQTSSGITGRINNKGEYSRLRCIERMCENELFGIYADGYLEDLRRLNPNNLLAHYNSVLQTASLDVFCICDTHSETEIRQYFDSNLSDLSKTVNDKFIPPASVVYSEQDYKIYSENFDSTQGKICMGFRCNANPASDDFFSLLLFNELFGGAGASKLFTRIREQESLCYYINSVYYRMKSIILVQSGVAHENFDKVAELTNQVAHDIYDGRFTREEFESAKAGLIKRFISLQDYHSALLEFYTTQYMLGDMNTPDDVLRRISALTPEDARRVPMYLDTVFTLK
jgi:predicted Zn-dependent peptidase